MTGTDGLLGECGFFFVGFMLCPIFFGPIVTLFITTMPDPEPGHFELNYELWGAQMANVSLQINSKSKYIRENVLVHS